MRILMGMALIALALPVAAAAQEDEPIPTAKPIGNPATWIPANGYPDAARASAEQGRVSFTLSVDETGRVSDCKVTKSSESPLLDETTCNFMTANGRFEVARDKRNKPTPSKWSSSMTWKLETAPPEPIASGTAAPINTQLPSSPVPSSVKTTPTKALPTQTAPAGKKR